MKKSLLVAAFAVGGVLTLLSFQKENSTVKKVPGPYFGMRCIKTYPSGTYTGIKCLYGGTQACTENNPNCNELLDS